MNKNAQKKMKVAVVAAFLGFFAVLFSSLFYSRALEVYPENALQNIALFLLLYFGSMGFLFICSKYIRDTQPSDQGKTLFRRALLTENVFVKIIMQMAFHFFPLYYALFVMKMDLLAEFKAIVIVFAWVAFLLVELHYIAYKGDQLFQKIIVKWNIEERPFLRLTLGIGMIVFFFGMALYIAYNLLVFYMVRFT